MIALFTKPKPEPAAISTEIRQIVERASALIREELSLARESLAPLAEKSATAQVELTSAQQRYDSGVQAFALGQTQSEPDRGELQAAVSKSDALRRIAQQQEGAVRRLTGELAQAELREAVAAGRDRLAPLIGAAEAKFNEFSAAVSVAKEAERALFALLFDEQTGLRRCFPDAVRQDANKARHSVRVRAMEISQKLGFTINPRFETDGLVNLGQEHPEYFYSRLLRR